MKMQTLQDLDAQPKQRLAGDTASVLAAHPDWIVPRSDVRVFLGAPGAPEATKTTIEPGNVFSPGMRTYGVTWWLRFPANGVFFATEQVPLESLHWSYEAGYLPLIHCETESQGISIRHSLFQDGNAQEFTEAVCGKLRLHSLSEGPTTVQVFVALRSLGPAGGPVDELEVGSDACSFRLPSRGLPLLGVDQQPTAIGCDIGDPSVLARIGDVPMQQTATDSEDGWCFGLMRFDVQLHDGSDWTLHLDCPLQTYGNLHQDIINPSPARPEQYDERAEAHLAEWRERFGKVSLNVPDADFKNAFYANLQHMLTAMVGAQARIAPLAYPLPWLRDSIFIIRALDLAGLHDIAHAATEYCARNDFFGGFGAEGDAPGQGIWALVEHYRVTGDKAWLATVYPAIRRKAEWIFRMRRTTHPIQVIVDTPVLPYTLAERASGIICIAARDGIIMGSMDHGIDYSVGWVNHWALCGLREAAFAAEELNAISDVESYHTEFAALRDSLQAFIAVHPDFFNLERTVNSLLWPTRVWEDQAQDIKDGFDHWWLEFRGTPEDYHPEPYWLYFEFAQAHNALLLGERERAWQVVEYRLQHQDVPGLYGWREGGNGVGTRNAIHGATIISQLRGCQRFDSIHPHGWSQSEMWLLQRALLVEEWQGGLLLFAGIPASWLQPNAQIRFDHFPTHYGVVSAALEVDANGRPQTVTVRGVKPGIQVTIKLPDGDWTNTSTGQELVLSL